MVRKFSKFAVWFVYYHTTLFATVELVTTYINMYIRIFYLDTHSISIGVDLLYHAIDYYLSFDHEKN